MAIIQATNEAEQILASNTASVRFSDVTLRTASANCFNGWLGYNQGEANFNIVAGGIYEIDFNANITSATAGDVALAIFADGVQLTGTEMDTVIVAPGDWHNVSVNRKIRVCTRGDATITIASVPSVTYSGGAAPVVTPTQIPIIKNANISIERLF